MIVCGFGFVVRLETKDSSKVGILGTISLKNFHAWFRSDENLVLLLSKLWQINRRKVLHMYAMTAQLWYHMKKFVAIGSSEFIWI